MRLAKVVEICQYIGSWDKDKILDFRNRVKPILEHNYKAIQMDSAMRAAKQVEMIVRKHTGEI